MIDYLQLMKGSEKRFDRREQVAEITRTAKLLANETGMTLVFLAQVNREGRKSGELTLAHLKESSTIEEDADAVLLLQLKQPPDGSPPYPPSYESVTGRWAKYRDGATGQFEMIFNKPHLTFSSTP
jgi:replicative DNA helicase